MMTQYAGNLYAQVETGQIFVIGGRSTSGASRVDIIFAGGKAPETNIALQLSIDFQEDVIIRNAKFEGQWGSEEREDNLNEFSTLNPIASGDTFKIYILVGDNRFHIAVNGRNFCQFFFRMPLSEIRTILIQKDVQQVYQVDHRQAFPVPFPAFQYDFSIYSFTNDAPKQFVPGHCMILTAIPFGNPKGRVSIDFLQNGGTKKILFHLSVRFNEKVVVRNSTNESLEWQTEERFGGFPFKIDQQFKLAIGFTENQFKFAVNGIFFANFRYRSSNLLDTITNFKISTDTGLQIEVTSVDHFNLGIPDCDGFEQYSHPDVKLW